MLISHFTGGLLLFTAPCSALYTIASRRRPGLTESMVKSRVGPDLVFLARYLALFAVQPDIRPDNPALPDIRPNPSK